MKQWQIMEKLYKFLFNEITDAIEDMNNQNFGLAKCKLINVQQKAEEIYISAEQSFRIVK